MSVSPYIRVRPQGGGPWCYMKSSELQSTLDGTDPAAYEVEYVQMSDEAFEALPDFEGW